MKVVYISGTFDVLHRGHISILNRAKSLGDFMVVGINSDEYVSSYKPTPIYSQEERRELVASLKFVDATVFHKSFDDMEAVLEHGATIRLIGPGWGNWVSDEIRKKVIMAHKKSGVKLENGKRSSDVSSTKIKEKIKNELLKRELAEKRNQGKSLESVAKSLGIKREKARQIETKHKHQERQNEKG